MGLDRVRFGTDIGRTLEVITDLDNASMTYRIDWNEITAEQSLLLQILRYEREKWRQELEQRKS